MDTVMSTQLTIPLYQLGLLVVIVTLALLLGRAKLGLIVTYLFGMYWVYWLNTAAILGSPVQLNLNTFIYFGSGIVITILALLGFFHRPA
jgi:hypothetical protein